MSGAAAMAAKAAAKAAGADVFIALTDKGVTDGSGANPTGALIDFANAVSGFDVIFGGDTDIQYSGIGERPARRREPLQGPDLLEDAPHVRSARGAVDHGKQLVRHPDGRGRHPGS